jgi:hypothetical protein
MTGEQHPFEEPALRALATSLPAPAVGAPWPVAECGRDRGLGRPFIARDHGGHLHFVLPVASTFRDFATYDRVGVGATVRDAKFGDDLIRGIDIQCRRAELEPTFFAMIAEAIRRMREPGVPEATTLRNVLQEFDDLFGRPPVQLTAEAAAGLFGELKVLHELCRHDRAAVRLWRGPWGNAHDFEAIEDAIEVKVHGLGASDVTINGERQLDFVSGSRLWLVVIEADRSERDGQSLRQLLDVILAMGVERDAVAGALSQLALAIDAPVLSQHRFVVRRTRAFEVAGEFPRIVGGSFAAARLPHGVRGLKYRLELGSISAWEITGERWNEQARKIARSPE